MIALKTLQKLGVLRMIALGVLRMIALKTLQNWEFWGWLHWKHCKNWEFWGWLHWRHCKSWHLLRKQEKTMQTFCSRVGARVHWMEALQIVTWDGCKNTYTISVACFLRICLRNGLCISAPKYLEILFMVELREIRVIIARNNFWRVNCVIISKQRVLLCIGPWWTESIHHTGLRGLLSHYFPLRILPPFSFALLPSLRPLAPSPSVHLSSSSSPPIFPPFCSPFFIFLPLQFSSLPHPPL